MENPYGYNDEQQGGYYEEWYSPDQGGSYYDPDCFDYSYDAHDYYANENSETCAGMEEQPRSKWEEFLSEQGLASLAVQVGDLEDNMGVLATAIGSKHTPGTLPSLPKVNPKGKCHVVQLRSGTTYQPPQAADLGKGMREKEQELTDFTPTARQTQ
ncbi:hypothetical protein SASPL_143806 [Salvia splendens]|uniref:Uncharacterized protein n=1 Tax=Salvia splendens TaxID=180675 RepID=A0A8X8WPJ7_SALSN|nr:hypothetical protein SASPL_143806 [Salvia splendens]